MICGPNENLIGGMCYPNRICGPNEINSGGICQRITGPQPIRPIDIPRPPIYVPSPPIYVPSPPLIRPRRLRA